VFIFALGKEADTTLNLKDCPGLDVTADGQVAKTSNLFGLVPPLNEFLKFISEFVIIV
jgi:hypothetical protein